MARQDVSTTLLDLVSMGCPLCSAVRLAAARAPCMRPAKERPVIATSQRCVWTFFLVALREARTAAQLAVVPPFFVVLSEVQTKSRNLGTATVFGCGKLSRCDAILRKEDTILAERKERVLPHWRVAFRAIESR